MDEAGDEKVGYGRPPRHGRFRPGHSGNPRGRPRGKRSTEELAGEVLDEKMSVVVNGRRRKVSAERVLLLRIRDLALKGDLKATRMLLDLRSGGDTEIAATTLAQLTEEDRDILRAAGFGEAGEGGHDEP